MAMFVWRRRAGPRWLAANEDRLREIAGTRLAIVQAPNRKTATAEIAATERQSLEKIRARFGGAIKRFPRDWLTPPQRREPKPIKVGRRLVIMRAGRSTSRKLIIPAGAAFGTGEHVTTAMSLRLLEQVTRNMTRNWSLLDLGTGTGILALAAKKFGAKRVAGIDSDPVAICVAKENAHLNRIGGIDFQVGDVRKFSGLVRFDIVTANLYSELLIEVLPKLKRNKWLIFSGILRERETRFRRALRRNGIDVKTLRRRGKWIALLCARGSGRSR
jgi:ribosomal protein L11 methyltransferase